ncbi:MAG: hypothetical protein LBG65_06600 [Puniceicoccales bacterium]|nr:hypothetical protein [Puniceicoccales bacterium]
MEAGNAGLFLLRNSISSSPAAKIQTIHLSPTADILILDAGMEKKFHPGMVLQVTSSTTSALIGEVILVDIAAARSAALVLDIIPGKKFSVGDFVAPKLLGV